MASTAVDKGWVRDCKLTYMALFDKIADPDGSSYPSLRRFVWACIESRGDSFDKHQQSQALAALTYTLMLSGLASAAAEALLSSDEPQESGSVTRLAWCLGMFNAIALTHPTQVEGDTALSVLGPDDCRYLFEVPIPLAEESGFWGELRVLGDALQSRIFALSLLSESDPAPLLYALGIGMGICTREEVGLRLPLVRKLLSGLISRGAPLRV